MSFADMAAFTPERRKAAFASNPQFVTIATTGTNGKTTTTSMVASIVAASGEIEAVMTTVGARVGPQDVPKPDMPGRPLGADSGGAHFVRLVEHARNADVRTIALEVTSLALAGRAAERWPADIAIFTNLTRDHLDVHPSPEAYLAAKAQLFLHLKDGGTAVLNRDDPSSALLREIVRPDVAVVDYSLEDAEATLCAENIVTSLGHTVVRLARGPVADLFGRCFDLGTTGRVHVANALGAALAALAAGYAPAAIKAGLEAFRTVAGRFEVVTASVGGPQVVVDYAHTPDGLENTLKTARELVAAGPPGSRVICIFGCGGGRDRGKRPMMGAIADSMSDIVILTSDNPRHEDPDVIGADVRAGVAEPKAVWHIENDRARAILLGIAIARDSLQAGRSDLVVVAGKGHETEQIIGDEKRPFSDVAVARSVLAAG